MIGCEFYWQDNTLSISLLKLWKTSLLLVRVCWNSSYFSWYIVTCHSQQQTTCKCTTVKTAKLNLFTAEQLPIPLCPPCTMETLAAPTQHWTLSITQKPSKIERQLLLNTNRKSIAAYHLLWSSIPSSHQTGTNGPSAGGILCCCQHGDIASLRYHNSESKNMVINNQAMVIHSW